MFGEFQFGAGEFAGTQALSTPVPPPTPGTFQRVKVVCQRLDCTGATDTATYSLQDLIPSRIVAAAECVELDCTGTSPDVESYNLQDALYFNGTPVTVPVICPPGANCTPGDYPPITYPPGTFVLPDVPTTPGEPFTLQLQGCQSNVSVTLPASATAAQIAAAVDYIIEQVALQQAQCDTFPDFPFTTVVSLGGFVTSACIGSAFAASITGASTPEDYPLSFAIVGGSLPPGISLSSSSATQAFFTGTPTTAGTYAFTLRATTAGGAVTTKGYSLAIGGITTASLAAAITGEPYSETFASTGMAGTLIWGLAAGTIPPGLTLNSSTGTLSGDPTTEGTYNFAIFVQNGSQQCIKSFSISVGTCLITTASPLPGAIIGDAYSTTLAATDITGTLAWSIIAGALPAGLTLNSATGEISGTPTTEETASFTAQVTSGDNTCQKEFSLDVTGCIITTSSPLPEATNGTPYSTTLAADDISGTLTWSLILGALPTGLSLNASTGEISGTPTVDETANFTAQVDNGLGNTCSKAFSLTVATAITCPDWNLIPWDNYVEFVPDGTASFTPINSPSNAWSGAVTSNDPFQGTIITQTGNEFVYNTTDTCQCSLDVTWDGNGSPSIGVQSRDNFGVLTTLILKNSGSLVPGLNSFLFFVPSTGGINFDMRVSVSVECGGGGFPDSCTFSGAITNVP